MAKIPPPRPPLDVSPTFRGRDVVLADGRIAAAGDVPAIARWTSLKLYVWLERYPFEWAQDRAPRLPAVRELVARLARAAKWKQLYTLTSAYSVRPPKPFGKSAFDAAVKKVALQRFNTNVPAPVILARTGGPLDVQYEWSFAVTECALALFAHDTPQNRVAMEKHFAAVRASHDGAVWATLSHGYAGSFSSAVLRLGTKWGVKMAFFDHDEAQLTPPWRVHIGRAWLGVTDAAKHIERYASKEKRATLDGDGLLVSLPAPKSATDRSSPRRSAWRDASRLTKLAENSANRAFHDPAYRRRLRSALSPAS